MRAAGCDCLLIVGGEVTGWCFRNVGLSLKLPSSTWAGVPFLQKNSKMLCILLEEEPGPCPKAAPPLIAPPLVLHPLPFLISNCLNLPFGTQGRSSRLNEAYSLQTRNGTQKGFILWSPTESCAVSIQGTGGQRLWPLPAKMGHSPASVWRIDTELEKFPSSKSWM